MSNLRKHFLAGATIAALALPTAAWATPVSVTWDPAGAAPTPLSANTSVTFSSVTLTDDATISIDTLTGTFTETGVLDFADFTSGGNNVHGTGLNDTYQIYATFSADGALNGSGVGKFASLTFTLFGDVGAKATFDSAGNVNPHGDAQDTLASGTLILDSNNKVSAGPPPDASADTTFTPNPAETDFFVSPTTYLNLDLQSVFTNTNGQFTDKTSGDTRTITITGGGGSADFQAVPEPASLALLGGALLGFGMIRRRRNRKA